jgi:hypothetical protein
MSLDDEELTNGRVFVDFVKTRRTLHALRAKRIQWGKQFEGIGKQLQSKHEITNIDLEYYAYFLTPSQCEEIRQTVADIKSAEREFGQLCDTLQKLGYADDVDLTNPV